MIVKIETKTGWVFYDAIDEAMTFAISPKEMSEQIDCPTTWWTTTTHDEHSTFPELRLIKLMNNNTLKHTFVLDNNKAYLMSDVGKTIERIN
jgi:hypothetical protein